MSIFDNILITPESLSEFGFKQSNFCRSCWLYNVEIINDIRVYRKLFKDREFIMTIMYDENTKSLFDDNNAYIVETIRDIELIVDIIKDNAK